MYAKTEEVEEGRRKIEEEGRRKKKEEEEGRRKKKEEEERRRNHRKDIIIPSVKSTITNSNKANSAQNIHKHK